MSNFESNCVSCCVFNYCQISNDKATCLPQVNKRKSNCNKRNQASADGNGGYQKGKPEDELGLKQG